MYDAGKIIIGLIIFLVLATSPFWYNQATGKVDYKPNPQLKTDAEACVMPTDYMREAHMDLLNDWRHSVVRDGERVHISHTGEKFNKSLSETCLDCHHNKETFCDECHNYSAVGQPVCWDCHIVPEKDLPTEQEVMTWVE